MDDESQRLGPVEGSSPTPLEKLDKAQRNRLAAAQLIAAAKKIETDKARVVRDGVLRDQRILGSAVMQLIETQPGLARLLVEGVGTCAISSHDQKHLARDGSALEQIRKIIETQASAPVSSASPDPVPGFAWFDVPFADKNRVPPGVLFDPETKARCAIFRHTVEKMRALGFTERFDLADRPPPPVQTHRADP